MATSAVGLFDDRATADAAVSALEREGFSRDEVTIVAAGDVRRGHELLGVPRVDPDRLYSGGLAGLIAGSFVGVLIAIGTVAVRRGSLPGYAPLVALSVCALLGVALGALVGMISGAGLPNEHLDYYLHGVEKGGTLVVVVPRDHDRVRRAADLLWENGAVDIEHRIEAWHGHEPSAVMQESLPT